MVFKWLQSLMEASTPPGIRSSEPEDPGQDGEDLFEWRTEDDAAHPSQAWGAGGAFSQVRILLLKCVSCSRGLYLDLKVQTCYAVCVCLLV